MDGGSSYTWRRRSRGMVSGSPAVARWATFDCYGTLIDWAAGMESAFRSLGVTQPDALLRAYFSLEPIVEAEQPFRTYRTVLRETLRRAVTVMGLRLAAGDERILDETLPEWPVFDDVGPALAALRATGWKLAILSNVDRDLLEGTLRRLPVEIDLVLTAEDVRSYKPAAAHFARFRELTGVGQDDWLHVAEGWYHDIAPARRLGIRAIWVNRSGEAGDTVAPLCVLPDLTDLPAVAPVALAAPFAPDASRSSR